jgi:caa(3)-type oxidase subunit IV
MRPLRDTVFAGPVLAWLGLMAALGASLAYAWLPGAPAKTWVCLAIAFAQIALIAVVLMRLNAASPLVRLCALAGLLWLSLLFILGFADLMTRLRPLGV